MFTKNRATVLEPKESDQIIQEPMPSVENNKCVGHAGKLWFASTILSDLLMPV